MDSLASSSVPPLAPGVYLVGTPVGNLEDVTLRALRVLTAANVLACEDTRVTRKLFQRYGIPAPKAIFSCRGQNERVVSKRLARLAAEGKAVAYCSDAGMPGISDPGRHIALAARAAFVPLEVVPGPSAVTAALALCGLVATPFTFFGFPPRRDGRLADILAAHGGLRPALVFYESPRRLARLLAIAVERLGPERRAAVCLELTKKFERTITGSAAALADRFAVEETRGEAVVVFEGGAFRREEEEEGGLESDR